MEAIKVIIEWSADGTVGAMMEKDMFAGQGDTVEAAVEDMKQGVKFFIETAKEKNFPYKDYLDTDYNIELEYDIPSMLEYARHYMTDAGLAKLTGIAPAQIGRYANGKTKPRPTQSRRILEGLRKFGTTFANISL